MQGCARISDLGPKRPAARRFLVIGAVLILCVACHRAESGGLFELQQVDAEWDNGRVTVAYVQRLQ